MPSETLNSCIVQIFYPKFPICFWISTLSISLCVCGMTKVEYWACLQILEGFGRPKFDLRCRFALKTMYLNVSRPQAPHTHRRVIPHFEMQTRSLNASPVPPPPPAARRTLQGAGFNHLLRGDYVVPERRGREDEARRTEKTVTDYTGNLKV